MEQYQIDVNDSRVYPMGLTRTDGGIHVSAVAAAKACSLLLFVKEDKNGKEARFREVRNIPFPEEGKTGHVWSMTERLMTCIMLLRQTVNGFPIPMAVPLRAGNAGAG